MPFLVNESQFVTYFNFVLKYLDENPNALKEILNNEDEAYSAFCQLYDLRYSIMNTAMIILRYSPTFYDYYLKKRSEGKCHRVALSHVCKKLIRVIYTLEKNNIDFDPSLLR